jgi:hypothetical protein
MQEKISELFIVFCRALQKIEKAQQLRFLIKEIGHMAVGISCKHALKNLSS